MSQLDGPSLNEKQPLAKSTKIKIFIGCFFSLVMIVLFAIAVNKINSHEAPPPIKETIPEDIKIEYDDLYIAQSSWRDGAWCAVDKDSVTAIDIVDKYDGEADVIWTLDEMLFYQNSEGAVYIAVGPGVHMIGSMRAAFANFPNAVSITGLEKLETSNVTDMSYIFSSSGFESIDISNWDTSSVTNFAYMLYDTTNTKNVNMNNLDLSNVVDTSYMFANSQAIENIYFQNVDTSHIIIMKGMFAHMGSAAHVAPTIFYGTLDTSSCTDMSFMFEWTSISNLLDMVKNFNTKNVTNMEKMFYHGLDIYELDLSGWDVSSVKNMNSMFTETICLMHLDMEGWNPISLETADYMFQHCHNLREFNQWSAAPNLKSAKNMFENCFELTKLDVTCFDGTTIENADRMFYGVQYVEHIYSNGFSVVNYTSNMFKYCVSLVGPTPYDITKVSSDMANTSGYFTPTK